MFNPQEQHSWQVFASSLLDSLIRHTHITSTLSVTTPTTLHGSSISFPSVVQQLGGYAPSQDSVGINVPPIQRDACNKKQPNVWKKAGSDRLKRGLNFWRNVCSTCCSLLKPSATSVALKGSGINVASDCEAAPQAVWGEGQRSASMLQNAFKCH